MMRNLSVLNFLLVNFLGVGTCTTNRGVVPGNTQVVNVGDRVFMECIVTGTPLPKITWSRESGHLPADAIVSKGNLVIPKVKLEDAGNYTCLAVNETGSFTSQVTLHVREPEETRRIAFAGDGFIEFDKGVLPHSKPSGRKSVLFVITTTQSDGLILWQRKPGGRTLMGGDHFAIGLRGGAVEYRFDMGSGPLVLVSKTLVNDGKPHTISVEKFGRNGLLTVDEEQIRVHSQGFFQTLNAEGNINIGGVSLIGRMTDYEYSENFRGFISDILIHNKGPLTPADAEDRFNVKPCYN